MPGPATSHTAPTTAVARPATGTIALYSDIGCPWARLLVHRLHRARRRLGLDGRVHIEHRPFPLERVNRRPTPMRLVEAEAAVIAGLDEEIPWQPWSASPASYPVTTLPALEAVQAVQADDPRAAEGLDLALRDAFFAESRCISLVDVILDVARDVPGVDAAILEQALQDGRARHLVRRAPDGVTGSPHAFLADGHDEFNCGVRLHTLESDVPVVDDNNPSAVDDLLLRAAR